ncbi:hypothetical protein BCR39DRAFT_449594, partial [Naematelia encephala]
MSQLLLGLAKLMPPPPAPAAREYDGLEYRWKALVFRPAAFKFEAVALGLIGAYLLVYFLGKTFNTSRAKSTFAPFQSFLATQFSNTRDLVSSGPTLHLLYSTGRRNVLFLHSTLNLLPFHDVAGLVTHFGKMIIEPTYDGAEQITFDLTLGKGEEGKQGEGLGVWAVVDKGVMRNVREQRWDLTFPRLHESSTVPITHSLFAEHSDVTDVLLKNANVGITELLNNAKAAGVLKYLLITDVPSRRPVRGPLPAKFRSRHIILSVSKPSNSAEVDAVKAWLQVALNIADLVARPNLLKPDVTRKLAATRKTVDADLTASYNKEVAEDAPPAETAEEKRLAKKKAERATMSEKELKRLDELEKKRELRKLQKK